MYICCICLLKAARKVGSQCSYIRGQQGSDKGFLSLEVQSMLHKLVMHFKENKTKIGPDIYS